MSYDLVILLGFAVGGAVVSVPMWAVDPVSAAGFTFLSVLGWITVYLTWRKR